MASEDQEISFRVTSRRARLLSSAVMLPLCSLQNITSAFNIIIIPYSIEIIIRWIGDNHVAILEKLQAMYLIIAVVIQGHKFTNRGVFRNVPEGCLNTGAR